MREPDGIAAPRRCTPSDAGERDFTPPARQPPGVRLDQDMHLETFVHAFAQGIETADARSPVALNARTGVAYQPGIGPHSESQTISLVLDTFDPAQFTYRREVAYPASPRARCDVVLDAPEPWAIEIKMLRLMGDNGRPNDNMLMHILSPTPSTGAP